MEGLLRTLGTWIREMPPGRRLALGVTAAVTLAALLAVAYWGRQPQYQLLYANLEPKAASAVLDELRSEKVPYRLGAGGRAIFVPAERVYDLRLRLAGKGLPETGSEGLELFDRNALGTTRFMQEVNYQRALQAELVRSISQIRGVRGARIHIVPPKESLFVEDREQARASVILDVDPGERLGRGQVKAIAHLVAGAVKGLDPARVAIVDSNGAVLQSGEEEAAAEGISGDELARQLALERERKERIEAILGRVVGRDHVIARVTAYLDFQRTESTAELYDPDATAVRSQHTHARASTVKQAQPGGVAGVDANLPGRAQPTATPKEAGDTDRDETVNYEVSKTVTRTVAPVGTIKRLSVAVLVDGTYKEVKGEDGKVRREFVPRTPEEIARFTALVKSAVGFDADRGDQVEVVSMPFAADTEPAPPPAAAGWQQYLPLILAAGRYGAVALFFLLFFLFFVRPLMGQIREAQEQQRRALELEAARAEQLALEGPDGQPRLLAGGAAAEEELPPEQRVSRVLQEDTSRGVQVMRSWLREAEESG
ncbi:MAG: flagellar M-ring protein FliF [Nitrospirae bacterium]|nr:MAG: flagellar M-ring protein FliF [Nitrospirota bacterium]